MTDNNTLLLTFLGIGTCIVGMSLIQKLFRRNKMKHSHLNESLNESVVTATLKEVSTDGLLDSETDQSEINAEKGSDVIKSTSSSSSNSDASINQNVRKTRRKLNSTLRKYRKTEKKLRRKKIEIVQMESEIENLMQAVKSNEVSMESLHEEFNSKKLEMLAITSFITPESESDIRKKEVICYKRYSNIKTVVDAKNVLTMIRQRQKALKTLEILTFKKYWSIAHKADKPENTAVIRSGLENWFRHFRHNTFASDSSQESQNNTQEEEKEETHPAIPNPLFVPLLESTI
ncbi:uncharacterized protein LOC143067674 [Mytilus galloprovincialis]|uniref:Uncharacterized protein n=1 Tax=Mytilus edulis TaxID=6550 RepID=A0A8S3RI41_MYTED|nr:unnamed protein product [Mytilus edulis]